MFASLPPAAETQRECAMRRTLSDIHSLEMQVKPSTHPTSVGPPAERAAASPVVPVSTLDLLRWLGDSQEGHWTGPRAAAAQQSSPQPAAVQGGAASAHHCQLCGAEASLGVSTTMGAASATAAGIAAAPAGSCGPNADGTAAAAGNAQQPALGRSRVRSPQQAATAGSAAAPSQPPPPSASPSEVSALLSPPHEDPVLQCASVHMAWSVLQWASSNAGHAEPSTTYAVNLLKRIC